jgi:hypothetical protein
VAVWINNEIDSRLSMGNHNTKEGEMSIFDFMNKASKKADDKEKEVKAKKAEKFQLTKTQAGKQDAGKEALVALQDSEERGE